jgi:hypothetical protein
MEHSSHAFVEYTRIYDKLVEQIHHQLTVKHKLQNICNLCSKSKMSTTNFLRTGIDSNSFFWNKRIITCELYQYTDIILKNK